MKSIDHVFVSQLCVHGHHGCLTEETALGQKFYLDIDCTLDASESIKADDPDKSVCYAKLCELAQTVSNEKPCKLIETFAHSFIERIFDTFPVAQTVSVTVNKPFAPVAASFKTVGVTIARSRAR